MKTKVVQVLLRRSETSETNDVVYLHEVPVLKIARGTANVSVTDKDCSDFSLKPFELQPRNEMIRLIKKYRGFSVDGVNPVNAAFPDGSRDIELFYKDPSKFTSADEEDDDEDFFNDDETFKSPVAPLKPVEPEKAKEAPAVDEDGAPATREGLLEALAALKVAHAPTLNDKQLKNLLVRTQEENFKALEAADEEASESA